MDDIPRLGHVGIYDLDNRGFRWTEGVGIDGKFGRVDGGYDVSDVCLALKVERNS